MGYADHKAGEAVLTQFVELMARLVLDDFQQQLAGRDLTLIQAQVLRALRAEPLAAGQLAARFGIRPSAVTQMTDRLLRKGLIERRALPEDRRAVVIALTTDGERLIDELGARRSQLLVTALADLKGETWAQVVAAFEQVITALEKFESRPMSLAGVRSQHQS